MIDTRLRPLVSRMLHPLVTPLRRVPPVAVTLLALGFGLGAAIAVAVGMHWVALGCWLVSRLLDGLDGALARRTGTASDFGGLMDMTLDTIVYSAVPIGIAYADGSAATWALCAVLLGSFYINLTSWSYLAALLEKRGLGAPASGEQTSITMPGGLVEGAETIVAYAVFLALPAIAPWGFAIMAVAVGVTAGQRVLWAKRHLR